MNRTHEIVSSLVLSTLGLLAVAPPVSACWNADRAAAAESPSWWTLSDEISPEVLRRRCRDLDAHRTRYRQEVRAGRAEPLSEQRLAELSLFVDGARTPELVPAWRAFATLADSFEHWPEVAPEAARRALASYGLGEAAFERVRRVAEERGRRAIEVETEVGEDFRWLESLSVKARAEGRGIEFEAAARRSDVAALSRLSGESAESLGRGLRARRMRPNEVSAVEAIVVLRQVLDEEEWTALRRFLLQEVAVGLRATGFETSGFDIGAESAEAPDPSAGFP